MRETADKVERTEWRAGQRRADANAQDTTPATKRGHTTVGTSDQKRAVFLEQRNTRHTHDANRRTHYSRNAGIHENRIKFIDRPSGRFRLLFDRYTDNR